MLDEPFNGLDPEGVRWMRTMTRTWAREGRAVLVSSHLMAEMAVTADHLVLIARGRLVEDMATDEFVARHCAPTVVARTPAPAQLVALLTARGLTARQEPGTPVVLVSNADTSTVGRLAATHHIGLDELSTRTAPLEEAFLRLTAEGTQFRGRTEGLS
ncbi:hypothetical protein SAMN05444320_104272 [Streptoalloteichus hindustanus]|uniref:ABC-2 type transport system ATP-binding protein n=1 Tax=Streptoalloteichus hindustanus TaxID=2017 RepID=A0A1M5D2K6_STRHI|nr:hypothetical protein SAMN05444320_104272 [Streptoalloteichus hindustanus]